MDKGKLANNHSNDLQPPSTTSTQTGSTTHIIDIQDKKLICKCMKSETVDKISIFLAELIGTALLVFMGCMSCIGGMGNIPTHLTICLSFGLTVMVLVNIFGCVSGCHINPAVTVAALIYEHITPMMAAVYITAQLLGGFMGFGVLKAVSPAHIFERAENSTGLCTTVPNPMISPLQAVSMEFFITLVLILLCCGVWDPRNSKFHDSVPIRFGLGIACLALVGGPYTGGSMNPARSLGPAIWNGDFQHHWVYWVGPLAAGAIGAYGYKTVFRREAPQEKVRKFEEFPLSRDGNENCAA